MGGLAGHMNHLQDNNELKIDEFVGIIKDSLEGKIEFTEKLDGMNIHILKHAGKLRFARNGGDLLTEGFGYDEIEDRFKSEEIRNIYREAFKFVENQEFFKKLLPFRTSGLTINCEVMKGRTNVVYYGDKIQVIPHNIYKWGIFLIKDKVKYEIDEIIDIHRLKPTMYIKPSDFSIETYINKIRNEFNRCGSKLETLNDYFYIRFLKVSWLNVAFEIPGELKYTIFDRIMNDNKSINLRELKKMISEYPEQETYLLAILERSKEIRKEVRLPLDKLMIQVGDFILQNIIPDFAIEWKTQVEIRNEVESLLRDPEVPETIKNEFLKRTNLKTINIEGVVFEVNGILYKYTGSFAPINQLIGSVRYSK